jgi:hypothetical protein
MKNKDYVIYCDMDETIVDCENQHIKYFGLSWADSKKQNGNTKAFKMIDDAGKNFWANMKWLKDGKELYTYLINNFEKVYILSNPGKYKASILGKMEWLDRELKDWKGFFEYEKFRYANTNSILIDDYYECNIVSWNKHGGIGIHHKNANNTIKKLEEILKR